MDINKLTNEIKYLISTKREDNWWDFKREHHHDKAELVHDILCMANNRPRRDSYIIFGVADDDFSITGVENDLYRRNQQGITDILRNITFVGSTRPRIEMQTFTINNHEIDVLIIKDSLEVPYYLEKDYQDKDVKNKNGKNYSWLCKYINLSKCVCYSDWENKYKFYQTIRFINGSRVSIRYYHYYKCLSIYIDSLPGLLYGSSQELYKYSDYPHFKKILSDLLNGVTRTLTKR